MTLAVSPTRLYLGNLPRDGMLSLHSFSLLGHVGNHIMDCIYSAALRTTLGAAAIHLT